MPLRLSSFRKSLLVILCCVASAVAFGQQSALTAGDYARAEKFMGYNTNPLVVHSIRPAWLPDGRFWYRNTTAEGNAFVVFDPAKAKGEPAFDHELIAAAISKAAGRKYDKSHLPFMGFEYSADG